MIFRLDSVIEDQTTCLADEIRYREAISIDEGENRNEITRTGGKITFCIFSFSPWMGWGQELFYPKLPGGKIQVFKVLHLIILCGGQWKVLGPPGFVAGEERVIHEISVCRSSTSAQKYITARSAGITSNCGTVVRQWKSV